MKTFRFWTKMLMIPAILMFFVGVFLVINNISVNSPVDDPFFKKFCETGAPLKGTNIIYSALSGIMGSVAASWSVFIFIFSRRLLKEPELWIMNCILIATTIWYIGDAGISYIHGVYLNVIFNTVFFLSVIIPIVVLKLKYKKIHINEENQANGNF